MGKLEGNSMIDDTNIDLIRQRQKLRAAMREHGLTEVIDHFYSAGDIVGDKLAIVGVQVRQGATDAEIKQAAATAAETYRKAVTEGPKS